VREFEKIASFEAFRDLASMHKNSCGKVLSNLPVFTGGIKDDITKGRLFYLKHTGGVLFLADEGSYYRAYYIWDGHAGKERICLDKPAVIEEINQGGRRDSYFEELQLHLSATGFTFYRNNLQVEKNLSNGDVREKGESREGNNGIEDASTLNEMRKAGLRFEYLGEDQMDLAAALWNDLLELSDIPQDHLIWQKENRVFGAFNEKGEMVAAQWWRFEKNASEGRHTATRQDYARRGIASALVAEWCRDAAGQQMKKCYTWISDANTRSLALYHKMGFRPNGRQCIQYILK